MPRRIAKALPLLLLAGVCRDALPAEVKPRQVQDLHYGEVLFQFYSEDYFTAITHLTAARDQNQLKHHAAEAELLLGGLEISYGMYKEAENQFLLSLNKSADTSVRNRIWYYLGKIAYQRGEPGEALGYLQKYQTAGDKALNGQYALLAASTDMALGNDKGAAERLKSPDAPADIAQYLQINRGIALLRMGNVDDGRRALDKLGQTDTDDEELRALRDRANLGLGYELLRAKQPDAALTYLNRVRLVGPFAQPALLGAGWSDAARGDFKNALVPWLELSGRDSHDTAVQEAQLAVPFALEKLQDRSRAIHFYEQAVQYFDAEEQSLKTARTAAQTDLLDRILAQLPKDRAGGWLRDNKELTAIPGTPYLIEVLAGNPFQEQLKNYRDIAFLIDNLSRCNDSIQALKEMVDARRQAYAQQAPLVRARLAQNEVAALEQRLHDYQQQVSNLEQGRDVMALATDAERTQWDKLTGIVQLLSTHNDDPQMAQLMEKSRLLKGVLYWQVQSQYAMRLWNIKKALRELEQPIAKAREQQEKATQALRDAEQGFTGYEARIDTLAARLTALIPTARNAQDQTGAALKQLVLEELDQREARLVSYRNQARYALARNYDQLAQKRESAE